MRLTGPLDPDTSIRVSTLYDDALRIVASFTENLSGTTTYPDPYTGEPVEAFTEYERGQLELLSDLFGLKEGAVDTESNTTLIARDIRELVEREGF